MSKGQGNQATIQIAVCRRATWYPGIGVLIVAPSSLLPSSQLPLSSLLFVVMVWGGGVVVVVVVAVVVFCCGYHCIEFLVVELKGQGF